MARYDIKGPISDETLNKINHMTEELYTAINDVAGYVTDEFLQEIMDGAKMNWKEPVESISELPTDAEVGDTRMVRDSDVGVNEVYRYNGSKWIAIQEIDTSVLYENIVVSENEPDRANIWFEVV